MTTASICCCSLLCECWVSAGMFRSFSLFSLDWQLLPSSGQGRLGGEAGQGLVGGVPQEAGVVDGGQAADLAGFVELDAGVAAAHRGGVRGRRPLVAAALAAALGVNQGGAPAVRELSERPGVGAAGR